MAGTRARSKTDGGRNDNDEPNLSDKDKILKLKLEKLEQRKRLTLFRRPLAVLYHFFVIFIRGFRYYLYYTFTHRVTLYFVLPFCAVWALSVFLPGEHHALVDPFNMLVKFVVWWVGLGVLSSVGLGTGMHSGILFLFPHIMKVSMAAQACKTLNFESMGNMWFTYGPHTFHCPKGDYDGTDVTFFGIFFKVFFACALWGAGTAAGEIPPYAISRAAALAGQANEELEAELSVKPKSKWDILGRMKVWMINFLQKYGFWGVFLMAAWPNMAFDLCGLSCGHFLMPFWTFFSATLLGKAVVKVNTQAFFFITLFNEEYLAALVNFVKRISPEGVTIHEHMANVLEHAKAKFREDDDAADDDETSVLAQLWNIIMFTLITYFLISCIEQFAKQHAAEKDMEEIERASRSLDVSENEKSHRPVEVDARSAQQSTVLAFDSDGGEDVKPSSRVGRPTRATPAKKTNDDASTRARRAAVETFDSDGELEFPISPVAEKPKPKPKSKPKPKASKPKAAAKTPAKPTRTRRVASKKKEVATKAEAPPIRQTRSMRKRG